MGQIWKGDKIVPVTFIKAEPNAVKLVREKEKNKYSAVQVSAPFRGEKKVLKEFRIKEEEEGNFKKGDMVTVAVFKEGDKVRVSGISKGKGFQGVVKRYGFSGGPKTHGQKDRLRAPGSIGDTAPQRVRKGKRMAGHMGVERKTIKNLTVESVDVEKNIIAIKGAVPGCSGAIVEIRKI